MDKENLVHMVNKIGSFFETLPDREEALQGIAGHIKSFWEPRMRRELLEYIDAENGATLTPIVLEAIRTHRGKLQPSN